MFTTTTPLSLMNRFLTRYPFLLWSRPIFHGRHHRNSSVSLKMIGLIPVIYYNSLKKAFICLSRSLHWITSVPTEVEHTLIWTKMPIFHLDLVADTIKTRIDQDGLWGFTGSDLPPPSPSNLPSCIAKLAEWGATMDQMIKSEPPSEEETILIQKAGREVHRYVKNRWIEKEWETAWFVNPPVSADSEFIYFLDC